MDVIQQHASELSRGVIYRLVVPALVACLLYSSTGCRVCPDLQATCAPYEQSKHRSCVTVRARLVANRLWSEKYARCYRNRNNVKDLHRGFVDGFIDTALGGGGCPPLVPPAPFCGCLPGANTQCAANAWYEGYPLGSAAAEQIGADRWCDLPVNPNLFTPPCGGQCNPGCVSCQAAEPCSCGNAGCTGCELGASMSGKPIMVYESTSGPAPMPVEPIAESDSESQPAFESTGFIKGPIEPLHIEG